MQSSSPTAPSSPLTHVVVNADDFGYSPGVNRGILEAHDRGIVTSASLMVEQPAAVAAADAARERPRLGLGLHVQLGSWRVSLLPRRGAARSAASVSRRTADELQDQVERFRVLVGRDPSHLDSHQHRHLAPNVRPHFERLAAELDVPLRRIDPRVRFCGDFYGHDGRGRPDPAAITVDALVGLIERLEVGITELCCHPGYPGDLDDWYRMEREQEVRALCDVRVREAIERKGVRLCSYHDVPLDRAVARR
jgi:chitin disaccharide deacetylase